MTAPTDGSTDDGTADGTVDGGEPEPEPTPEPTPTDCDEWTGLVPADRGEDGCAVRVVVEGLDPYWHEPFALGVVLVLVCLAALVVAQLRRG